MHHPHFTASLPQTQGRPTTISHARPTLHGLTTTDSGTTHNYLSCTTHTSRPHYHRLRDDHNYLSCSHTSRPHYHRLRDDPQHVTTRGYDRSRLGKHLCRRFGLVHTVSERITSIYPSIKFISDKNKIQVKLQEKQTKNKITMKLIQTITHKSNSITNKPSKHHYYYMAHCLLNKAWIL